MLPLHYESVDRTRKRPHEQDDETSDDVTKRIVNKSFLRLVVNTKSLGYIIGKMGVGVDEIRKTTGVEIVIDNSVEPFENLPERFITCSGFVDNLVSALSLILKRLPYQYDRIPEGDVCKILVIAAAEAGKLLGKGGETIRKLNEETKTTIRLSNDLESPADRRNRVVIITGKEEDVLSSLEKVKAIVNGYELADYPNSVSIRVAVPIQTIPLLFPEDHLHNALSDFPNVSIRPAPLEDIITGYRTQGVDVSGPTGDVVRVSALIEKLVQEWIDTNVINPTAVTLKLMVNKLVAGVVIGKGGTNIRLIQSDFHVKIIPVHCPVYSALDLEKMFYLVGKPEDLVKAVHFLLNQLAVNSIERRLPVDLEYYSAKPLAWKPFLLPPMIVPMDLSPTRYYPSHPMYYPVSYTSHPIQPTVHYTYISGSLEEGKVIICIPKDLCGRVLGKRGVAINYIKENTSCSVVIQQRDELRSHSTTRSITVSGSAEGIACALKLIHLFINLSPNDIALLITVPLAVNTDLHCFLAPYPDFSTPTQIDTKDRWVPSPYLSIEEDKESIVESVIEVNDMSEPSK